MAQVILVWGLLIALLGVIWVLVLDILLDILGDTHHSHDKRQESASRNSVTDTSHTTRIPAVNGFGPTTRRDAYWFVWSIRSVCLVASDPSTDRPDKTRETEIDQTDPI